MSLPQPIISAVTGHTEQLYIRRSIESGMNQVLEVNAEDFDVKVEAGVTREDLNYNLKNSGLFFP